MGTLRLYKTLHARNTTALMARSAAQFSQNMQSALPSSSSRLFPPQEDQLRLEKVLLFGNVL